LLTKCSFLRLSCVETRSTTCILVAIRFRFTPACSGTEMDAVVGAVCWSTDAVEPIGVFKCVSPKRS
jgi:hypothetical protein